MKRPWALPLVPLYAAGAALQRIGITPKRLAWPVISVGGLSSGGAGKTPFVVALAQLLNRNGVSVDVLSRGYGRTDTAVLRVDPAGSAERFGDEPILIAREAGVPVFVGRRRYAAGTLAELSGTDSTAVHLLDDGFQHRRLYRDVDVALVSSADLDDSLLPAGNLREGLAALKRATVLAVPVEDDAAVDRLRSKNLQQPIWRFRRKMEVPAVSRPLVAFCGIARPEQFFDGLEERGISIAARQVFADHHRFQPPDLESLRRLVLNTGAVGLVTTAKDRVRMGSMGEGLAQTAPLYTAGLQISVEDEAGAAAWLKLRLPR